MQGWVYLAVIDCGWDALPYSCLALAAATARCWALRASKTFFSNHCGSWSMGRITVFLASRLDQATSIAGQLAAPWPTTLPPTR